MRTITLCPRCVFCWVPLGLLRGLAIVRPLAATCHELGLHGR